VDVAVGTTGTVEIILPEEINLPLSALTTDTTVATIV
jgi:hypothetical protein